MAAPGQNEQDPGLWEYFSAVAGADGQIDHKELQKCLTNSGSFNLYKQDQPFSLETCTLMINMLDTNYSGKMEFTEFKELMAVLNKWMEIFMTFDKDHSTFIEPNELQQALASFGHKLSPPAMGVVLRRYSIDGKVSFDNFIALCVRINSLTSQFQARDPQRNAVATFNYDEFIQVTLAS